MDKISIIVPVFNGKKYIERCANSILKQSYRNIELILVNDGSSDNSLEICNKIAADDKRVKVLSQQNKGVSSARNKGLQYVTGDLFTFVDVDDCLLPEMLESAIHYLKETGADVVTYGWNRYTEEKDLIEPIHEEFEIVSDCRLIIKRVLEHYSACGGGYPWNKIWKKSEHLKMQLFSEELFYFEDLEWVIRMMLQVNKLVVCPECLYQYSVHEGSVTTDSNRAEAKEISYHRAIDKIIEVLELFPDIQWWMKEKYAPEIVNGIVHAKRNEWNELEEYLRKQLNEEKQLILQSKKIPLKTKARCLGLLFRK